MLIGLLMATMVASGCGGGDDDSSLSKAEFTKQANAICSKRENEKNEALTKGYENPEKYGIDSKGKKAEEELISKLALPPIVTMTEELGELGAPEGQEEKVEAMVRAFDDEVGEIETDLKGVLTGEVGEFAEANKLAKELGLDACSSI